MGQEKWRSEEEGAKKHVDGDRGLSQLPLPSQPQLETGKCFCI